MPALLFPLITAAADTDSSGTIPLPLEGTGGREAGKEGNGEKEREREKKRGSRWKVAPATSPSVGPALHFHL